MGHPRNYSRTRILRRDDYTCQRCGFSTPEDGRPLEVAHKVAVSDGGTSKPSNLETMCIACHSEYDGWEVGDFEDSTRVPRAASYVRDRMDVDRGAHFIRAFMHVTGIEDAEKAKQLLKEYNFL